MREEVFATVHPLCARQIGVPIFVEDELTNLCRKVQEWDGDQMPIEAYRALVEREIWKLGLEAFRQRYP